MGLQSDDKSICQLGATSDLLGKIMAPRFLDAWRLRTKGVQSLVCVVNTGATALEESTIFHPSGQASLRHRFSVWQKPANRSRVSGCGGEA